MSNMGEANLVPSGIIVPEREREPTIGSRRQSR